MAIDWLCQPWSELERDRLYAVMELRQRVFVVEQRCAYLDADGRDPQALHLLGLGERGALIAYLRAFAPAEADAGGDARIGRVVTAPEVRGTGLGRPLMRAGEAMVRARFGRCAIRVSAQAHLQGFYASLGYAVIGPGYDEDGIPHLPMRLEAEAQ